MNTDHKKFLVNVLAIASKMVTLAVPSAVLQLALQDGIDIFKDGILDLPDKFPTVEDVLGRNAPMVCNGISDILSGLDNIDELTISFENPPEEVSNMLIRQYINQKVNMDYSEDEMTAIRVGLSAFIEKIRLWSTDNRVSLEKHLERIDSSLLEFKKKIREVEENQQAQKKVLNQLGETQQAQANEINAIKENVELVHIHSTQNIQLVDQRDEIGERFYNYFIADSTYSIKKFFLFDNYEQVVLSERIHKLEQKNPLPPDGLNLSFQLDDLKKIIDNQRILLITGLYGTGKTALLKKLCLEFENYEKISTHFFQANSIVKFIDSSLAKENVQHEIDAVQFNGLDKLKEKFESFICNEKNAYIFIDELDEMNIALENNQTYLDHFVTWLCTFQSNNPSVTFILASRKYSQIGENDSLCVADMLFEKYYYANIAKSLVVIQTRNFSPSARDQWIEEFTRASKTKITYSEIKKTYGKIAGALVNPIFLFAFMRRFIEEHPSHEMKGYYYYYSSFIEETISGRYGFTQKAKFTESEAFSTEEDYYKILREIAFCILNSQEKVITSEIYKESIEDVQPVLADALTSRKFEIQLSQLSKLMPKKDYDKASLINCYFFNMDRRRVYFTDTNILFSLAAEHIFYSVQQQAEQKCEFDISHLENIQLVKLYPQLADYVIYLTINSAYSDYIIAYLNSFVRNNFIRSHYIDLSNEKINRVERIILLYILFLKTYLFSYKEFPHIFKEILYYVNAYKTNVLLSGADERTYVIERYFMNIHLHDVLFKRLNLKYFNFQGSNLTGQCKFFQCNFLETNIKNVIMTDAIFELCDISKVKQFCIKETKVDDNPQAIFNACRINDSHFVANNLVFKNCFINGLEIDLDGKRHVAFEHCNICNLKINNRNNLRKKPMFSHCTFENIPTINPFSREEIKHLIENN